MSINNTGFLQTLIASRTSGGSQSIGCKFDGGSLRGVNSDLWRSGGSNEEMSVKQGEDSTEITTPGGYKITGFGQDSKDGGKLEIVDPNGKKTTVWGDPHVDQTDKDGNCKRAFDVKARTTFTLPDKTVITMNMKPSTNGTDTTMLSDVMVTNGDKGVLMSDMMSGKGNMTTEEGYGPMMDDMVDDGNVLNMGRNGEFYEMNRFGGKSKVTQASINRTEEQMNAETGESTEVSDDSLSEQFLAQLLNLLSGFNSEFLRTLQSGTASAYSSRYSGLGTQNLMLDTSSASWF